MKLESWDEDIWRTRDRSIDRPVLRPDTGQKLDVNRRLLGRSHTTYFDASVLQRAQAARMPQQVLNQLLFQHLGARKRAFVEVALDRCECRLLRSGRRLASFGDGTGLKHGRESCGRTPIDSSRLLPICSNVRRVEAILMPRSISPFWRRYGRGSHGTAGLSNGRPACCGCEKRPAGGRPARPSNADASGMTVSRTLSRYRTCSRCS